MKFFNVLFVLLAGFSLNESFAFEVSSGEMISDYIYHARESCKVKLKTVSESCDHQIPSNDTKNYEQANAQTYKKGSIYDLVFRLDCSSSGKPVKTYFCFVKTTPVIKANVVHLETALELSSQ